MHLGIIVLSFLAFRFTSAILIDTRSPGLCPFHSSISIGNLTTEQVTNSAQGIVNCKTSGGECSDSNVTTKGLNDAFATYGLKTLGEKGAMLAHMAFESGDFKYNKGHFPAKNPLPGQGTKSMLSFPNIYWFASSFKELESKVAALSPKGKLLPWETPWDEINQKFNNTSKNAIRELVLGGKYTFKAGPWFLISFCDGNELDNGYQGFNSTMVSCFYAMGDSDKRKQVWCRTMQALVQGLKMEAPAECD